MKTLKGQLLPILSALRNELRQRQLEGFDSIFGHHGLDLMERLVSRLHIMPDGAAEKHICQIVNTQFIEFLQGNKNFSRSSAVHDDWESLETIRTNVAALNIMAASGTFQDPNYEVSVGASEIVSRLARDIELFKQIAGNEIA